MSHCSRGTPDRQVRGKKGLQKVTGTAGTAGAVTKQKGLSWRGLAPHYLLVYEMVRYRTIVTFTGLCLRYL